MTKITQSKPITDKDYITITPKGVFVGGREAKTYHGQNIAKIDQLMPLFFG